MRQRQRHESFKKPGGQGRRKRGVGHRGWCGSFKGHHKASSGPASEYRPIFGEVRGSDYKDYFGKTIPALCCYAKKGDRAPLEVFPRSDKKLGRGHLTRGGVGALHTAA